MSNEHDQAVLCIADSRVKALGILERLRVAGFREHEVSCVLRHEDGDAAIGVEGESKAPEGAATGGTGGLLVGGALGWMAGIGALAIPGLGPFIAAGPIMAALGGAAIGTAVGGLGGALIGMGIPEYEAKQYEGYLGDGDALISVVVANSDEVSRAKKIFEDADASHISTQSLAEVEDD